MTIWDINFSFRSSLKEIILLFNNDDIELDLSNDSDNVSFLIIWISSISGKSNSLFSKLISLKTLNESKTSSIAK